MSIKQNDVSKNARKRTIIDIVIKLFVKCISKENKVMPNKIYIALSFSFDIKRLLSKLKTFQDR